jgi:hypothetical protein
MNIPLQHFDGPLSGVEDFGGLFLEPLTGKIHQSHQTVFA